MKIKTIIAIWIIFTGMFLSNLQSQVLKVSENGRFIQQDNGKPFLWLGDTAWELFHKLNREEATEYLQNRADKGFTVIQAVVLAELDGLRTPNFYGDLPFNDVDPTKPNERYFEHVDYIVNKAEELGLFVGMLPTWGDKVFSENPGAGPEIFNVDNARVYGKFLGTRYKNKPIIWILGGDRNVANQEVFEIWNSMAKGIQQGSNDNQLMTYHPRGTATSSFWFHHQPWLDINMYQSGHETFNSVYRYAEDMYLLKPHKPFVDGEPAYEDIPVRFWEFMDFSKYSEERVPQGVLNEKGLIIDSSHFKLGFVTDYDVRVHAYWNFLSGACGYTYGNNAVWQMFRKGGEIAIPALTDWQTALDRPGANDMTHLRAIFESRPFEKLVPNQSLIFGVNRENENHIRAAVADDQSYAFIYLAAGQKVSVVTDVFGGDNVIAWWYNPREGSFIKIENEVGSGIHQFSPPSNGKENDWLLVIDKVNAGYKAPGVWNP